MKDEDMTDLIYMQLAIDLAKLATCPRASCGTVLVKGSAVIGMGYNGAATGELTCHNQGCITDKGNHCILSVHSEAAAICHAAKNGYKTDGCTAYLSQFPCQRCLGLLAEAGVRRLVVNEKGTYHHNVHGKEYVSESLLASMRIETLKM